jgi:hypothetical protein
MSAGPLVVTGYPCFLEQADQCKPAKRKPPEHTMNL